MEDVFEFGAGLIPLGEYKEQVFEDAKVRVFNDLAAKTGYDIETLKSMYNAYLDVSSTISAKPDSSGSKLNNELDTDVELEGIITKFKELKDVFKFGAGLIPLGEYKEKVFEDAKAKMFNDISSKTGYDIETLKSMYDAYSDVASVIPLNLDGLASSKYDDYLDTIEGKPSQTIIPPKNLEVANSNEKQFEPYDPDHPYDTKTYEGAPWGNNSASGQNGTDQEVNKWAEDFWKEWNSTGSNSESGDDTTDNQYTLTKEFSNRQKNDSESYETTTDEGAPRSNESLDLTKLYSSEYSWDWLDPKNTAGLNTTRLDIDTTGPISLGRDEPIDLNKFNGNDSESYETKTYEGAPWADKSIIIHKVKYKINIPDMPGAQD